MSGRFDVYLAGDSWLHRLDPRAKLWAALLAGLTGLLFRHLAVLAALLLVVHVGLFIARIPAARVRWLWARLVPLLLLILILQPLFAPGPGPDLLRMGSLRLTVAGILEGVSFALRAAALTFLAALLLLTTDPSGLVQGVVKLGVPYTWGLTVGLAIRYLPTTYGLLVTVREAQQARGWVLERGNPLRRARAYVPILVATIIAALRLSDNLGLALAARGLGYPARRTAMHDLTFGTREWALVILVGLVFGGLLALRYGLGFGGRPW
jgi:energy-coupling factor transport system permease protein